MLNTVGSRRAEIGCSDARVRCLYWLRHVLYLPT